jgi:hypothetical protein
MYFHRVLPRWFDLLSLQANAADPLGEKHPIFAHLRDLS